MPVFSANDIINAASVSPEQNQPEKNRDFEVTPELVPQQNLAFTKIPNFFLDELMAMLTPSELRVMLYIYRHTLGYGKLSDSLSYDQFLNGISTRQGKQLDKGAGVSRRALVTALASLEGKGLIERQHDREFSIANIILCPVPGAAITQNKPSPVSVEVNKEVKESSFTKLPSLENVVAPTERRKRQNLHPVKSEQEPTERINQEVQILPAPAANPVQNLHPTKETVLNQNKKGDGSVAVIAEITDKVVGIKADEVEQLIKVALANGRDTSYLLQLANYVATNPKIHIPAAVFTSLVRRNQDRTLPVLACHNKTVWPNQSRPNSSSSMAAPYQQSDLSSNTDSSAFERLSEERCINIWQQASDFVKERWGICGQELAGGILRPGAASEELLLEVPAARNSMTRLRLCQCIKDLLNVQVTGYRIIW